MAFNDLGPIPCQNNSIDNTYFFHFYLHNTLPLLESHLDPKFVIFNAGEKLQQFSSDDLEALHLPATSSCLSFLVALHSAWMAKLSEKRWNDPLFNGGGDSDNEGGKGGGSNDDDND